MASQWTTLSVDGQNMWAYMSLPDGPGPHPGVIVIPGGRGLGNFTPDFARRLAAAGYAAIAPNMYHRDDPTVQDESPFAKIGRLRDDTVIKDVNTSIRHLSTLPMELLSNLVEIPFHANGRSVRCSRHLVHLAPF